MKGIEGFEQFFAEIFKERWERLRGSLLSEHTKVALKNPFGLQDYHLDEASILPIKHLDLSPGQRFADFCASPGGKSLAAIFSLKGEGTFTLNDLSPARVARLKAVMHDCLPPEVLRRVYFTQGDASRWGVRNMGPFDRILVDAPCSGEKHLIEKPAELGRWSKKGSQRLSMRQHALLCAAVDICAEGGRVVYSTCSISPLENDGVIEKLLKSRRDQIEVLRIKEERAESTEHGHIALPDQGQGGPIYFSVLQKI